MERYQDHQAVGGGWVFVTKRAAVQCARDLRKATKNDLRVRVSARYVRADTKALAVWVVTGRPRGDL